MNKNKQELYIGLMSGTSVDGIDAALVDFSDQKPHVIASHYTPYTPELREKIFTLCQKGENEIHRMAELDIILGQAFAAAVKTLLNKACVSYQDILAIGSHGQNIRHHPHMPYRFTLQIGDPNIIAAETGITTVADFRRKDIAFGGQGAPLVPAFHHYLLGDSNHNRAIVNIGGIANITLLSKNHQDSVLGFDTGPGNALSDAWIALHENKPYDKHGAFAAKGQCHEKLLSALLLDPYFHLPAPKSTGREYFNLNWLNTYLAKYDTPLSNEDVQATLIELTAKSIVLAINQYQKDSEIIICGGGIHNHLLMQRLQQLASSSCTVSSIANYGVDPDLVEAIAFAWLARQTINKKPGNLPHVTGAKSSAILGGIYYS